MLKDHIITEENQMTRKSNETTLSSPRQYDSQAGGSESFQWFDISVPLRNAMVHWPSDPPVRIENVKDMEHGASSTLSMISMGPHTGTHMDAPLHSETVLRRIGHCLKVAYGSLMEL